MYPLIEITSVPIEIRMKMTNASMEYTRGTAEMEISRSDHGLDIKSRPIRVQIDTYEARQSLTPGVPRSIGKEADDGEQAAYEATATYAQHGQIMLNARLGQNLVAQIASEPLNEQIAKSEKTSAEIGPVSEPEIDWEDGELQIRYDMEKLNFDWKIEAGEFEFTPGDIEFVVEQRPDLIIRYMGGPIYVPPSADPNYVDVKA